MASYTSEAHTTLQFLGAAETVTGSKYLLRVAERRILVDFGMFQGRKELRDRNWERFPFDPAEISDVLLTHAHMDHVGLLPRLVREGFRGPVLCTEGTARLAEIVLRDGAKIQEQDAEDANKHGYSKHHPALPLYTTEDVENTLPLLVSVPYDEDIDLDDGIVARFTRAAHILGSASITVWTEQASVTFSGDIGSKEHPVLRSREAPPGAPFALIESTYGDRDHPEEDGRPHEEFADIIRRTIERGGSVLVPAFAVDRTEVVLKTLSDFRRADRIPHVPVYIDSPMANAALQTYLSMPEELRSDMHPEDFLEFPGLRPIRSVDESKALTQASRREPSIIIAASGMATGGRVVHHLEAMLPDAKNSVVLTGYQAIGTRGRQLAEGADKLKMRGRYIHVNAEIYQDHGFSVHGDRGDLLEWIGELDPRPEVVFCVHGEVQAANALAKRIEEHYPGIDAIVPTQGEVIVLDSGTVPVARPETARPVERHVPAPAVTATARHPETSEPIGSYELLSGESPDQLSQHVTDALAKGFAPFGAPSVGTVDGSAVYLQAVVRRH
ncbi:MBL fold metallo-hydrolase [Gulosibacter molinativorax]|uniref:MBL fold metallo-hydrolase n=1 Tax=Gulosibacter molinativorax TaxID=256821 RepID=UPI00041B3E76|nr:MBL fold metallo-hydrolase [Gulosibacter molinativorax]QUY60942.1 Predicted exonuclease of the beta-lactamase fold involved in RNA processing [Gulosibacter molinativorax]